MKKIGSHYINLNDVSYIDFLGYGSKIPKVKFISEKSGYFGKNKMKKICGECGEEIPDEWDYCCCLGTKKGKDLVIVVYFKKKDNYDSLDISKQEITEEEYNEFEQYAGDK